MPRVLMRGSLLVPAAGLALVGGAAYYLTHPQRVAVDPPADLANACRDVWLDGTDGVRLHAVWITCVAADGGAVARTIVHQHGYNAAGGVVLARAANFRRGILRIPEVEGAAPLLAWPLVRAGLGRGYNFLLVDGRGHGRSGGRWDPSGERLAAELASWAAWLRQEQGQRGVGLWGNSFGASAGMALSLRPAAGGFDAMVLDSPVIMARGVYSGIVKRPVYWMVQPVLERLANKEFLRQVETMRPWAPILLIHGTNDSHVPFWQSQYAFGLLQRPEAPERMELWLVPGADHLEALEVEPEAYVRRMLDWFDHWMGSAQ